MTLPGRYPLFSKRQKSAFYICVYFCPESPSSIYIKASRKRVPGHRSAFLLLNSKKPECAFTFFFSFPSESVSAMFYFLHLSQCTDLFMDSWDWGWLWYDCWAPTIDYYPSFTFSLHALLIVGTLISNHRRGIRVAATVLCCPVFRFLVLLTFLSWDGYVRSEWVELSAWALKEIRQHVTHICIRRILPRNYWAQTRHSCACDASSVPVAR